MRTYDFLNVKLNWLMDQWQQISWLNFRKPMHSLASSHLCLVQWAEHVPFVFSAHSVETVRRGTVKIAAAWPWAAAIVEHQKTSKQRSFVSQALKLQQQSKLARNCSWKTYLSKICTQKTSIDSKSLEMNGRNEEDNRTTWRGVDFGKSVNCAYCVGLLSNRCEL